MIATLFHDGKNTSIEHNHLIKEGFEVKFCIPNTDSYTVWFEKRKEN